ncbi:MAG: 4Fe-4S binding protein [Desulfohalobiaceae bacterium]
MLDVGRHPNIELLAYSEVEELRGTPGSYQVSIRKKARYVDESKCTGCGACTEKCPTVVPDAFNEGLGSRKAIYTWFAQGIPSTHTVDPEHCRQLKGKKCGVCEKTCQADAIDFEQTDRILDYQVGAVIVANGYQVFDPSRVPEYRYRDLPNVLTSMEFERLLSASGPTAGHLDRPSDLAVHSRIQELQKKQKKSFNQLKKYEKDFELDSAEFYTRFKQGEFQEEEHQKWAQKYQEHLDLEQEQQRLQEKAEHFKTATRIAFIQCVGSRDLRFYPFCSGYCCMHSIKEAIIAHEHDPHTESTIFGMDIRAVGKGFEEYKIRGGNNSNITYRRAKVAEISKGPDDNPLLTYEDTLTGKVVSEDFELVILATACEPGRGTAELADKLGLELNEFGFIRTSPSRPLDTSREGIFVCGCAGSPMDIPESVAQASSAASRAVQFLNIFKQEAGLQQGKAS